MTLALASNTKGLSFECRFWPRFGFGFSGFSLSLGLDAKVLISLVAHLRYDTIRYDIVCLTCSKKLTGSQLSLPHGTNKKLKCKTKNKTMSVIGPVQSRYREAVQ